MSPRTSLPMPSLAELRKRYVEEGRAMPESVEEALRADGRVGAKSLLAAVQRRRSENRKEGQRLRALLKFEQPLWDSGTIRIAGVDEAGMSPLAGPVSAGAVILPVGCKLPHVDDSKKLTPARREELAVVIKREAVAWCVAFAEPHEIDRINIHWAGILAMKRAVLGLFPAPQYLLIDARTIKDLDVPQQGIVRGDQQSLCIAAASILAKTTRDALMREMDVRYPGYGFAQHKGYPVKQHYEALARLGPCAIHRKSFGPVQLAAAGNLPAQGRLFP